MAHEAHCEDSGNLRGGLVSGQEPTGTWGGIGDIGAFFAALSATVVSAEYRTANRNFASIRWRKLANFQSVPFDGEQDFSDIVRFSSTGHYDLILALGFLEVVQNVDNVIRCSTEIGDHVVLETMVCDSTDPQKIVFVEMGSALNDHPIRGKSARPSPAYIERVFEEFGWSTNRYFHADLNTPVHRYDWQHKDDGSVDRASKMNRRRFWHFRKKEPRTADPENLLHKPPACETAP